MPRSVLSRRALLAAGSTAIALPLLDAMLGTARRAHAQSTRPAPQRYVVCFGGTSLGCYNDPVHNLYVPDTVGADYDLKAALAPLANYGNVKNEISVVSGLRIPWAQENGGVVPRGGRIDAFHSGMMSPLLSGVRQTQPSVVAGESSDQLVARTLGSATTFPSLVFRAQAAIYGQNTPENMITFGHLSYRRDATSGAIERITPTTSPHAAFNTLFSSLATTDPAEAARIAARQRQRASILDVVRDRAARLSARVGAADRARIDQHLTEIRALEQRVTAMPPPVAGACQRPADPGEDAPLGASYSGENERARAFCDLLYMALVCDLTRVGSLMFTYFSSYLDASRLPQVGPPYFTDVHNLSHQTSTAVLSRAVAWHTDHFGYLVARLRDTPEGASNMLANSALVLLHEGGHGRDPEGGNSNSSHSTENMACLIAGRAGGLRAGRHVPTPGMHPANVLNSAMRAVGVDQDLGEVAGVVPGLFG